MDMKKEARMYPYDTSVSEKHILQETVPVTYYNVSRELLPRQLNDCNPFITQDQVRHDNLLLDTE